MKRILGALLLTIGLAAGPLTAASAAPEDPVRGPSCGDITGDALYTAAITGEATVFSSVDTPSPTCTTVTYSVSVYTTGASPQLLGQASIQGDGVNTHLNLPPVIPGGAPGSVCVSLASSIASHTIDPAPNSPDGTCSIGTFLLLSNSTGASGMR